MLRQFGWRFLLSLIWSSSFMTIKVGVGSIPPVTLAACRVVVAAVVLYGFVRVQGEVLPRGARFWTYCVLIGIIGNGLPFTLINWGEEHVDSSLAAILMSIMPLATVVLAHFFADGERMTRAKLAGVVIGFCGVIILVGPEALKGLGGDAWRQLAVAAGAFSYGVAMILARNMPPAPLIARSAAVMIVASVIMAPLALAIDVPWRLRPDAAAIAAALYLGLFPTAFATIIFFHLVQTAGPSMVALVNYLIPVLGVGWGAVVLDEQVTAEAVAALVVILAGIAIAQVRRGAVTT
ncbi:MAG: EamA family transporter [Rhodospirillales bacterium]|nr:EamA family transporter [Rhodospirillales bacterium]